MVQDSIQKHSEIWGYNLDRIIIFNRIIWHLRFHIDSSRNITSEFLKMVLRRIFVSIDTNLKYISWNECLRSVKFICLNIYLLLMFFKLKLQLQQTNVSAPQIKPNLAGIWAEFRWNLDRNETNSCDRDRYETKLRQDITWIYLGYNLDIIWI